MIEVEPAEASFGLGFSEPLAGSLDAILDMVGDELADAGRPREIDPDAVVMEPSGELSDLLAYAEDHARARRQSEHAPALVETLSSAVPGVSLTGKVRPWGVFTESGGDWFDAIPLAGGVVGSSSMTSRDEASRWPPPWAICEPRHGPTPCSTGSRRRG